MSQENLDNYEVPFIDFYLEIPASPQDESNDGSDYIDGIDGAITDLHEELDAHRPMGLSDKQVSSLAQDQYTEAGIEATHEQVDATLFNDQD